MQGKRRVLFAVACFAVGVALGVLGTLIHGNIWVLGDVGSGLVLPWGAVFALVLVFAALVWAGTTSGSLAEVLLLGGTVFTVVTAVYLWPGPDQLMVHYSPQVWESLPGPVIASVVWWLGSAAVTILAMFAVRVVLITDDVKRRRAQAQFALEQ